MKHAIRLVPLVLVAMGGCRAQIRITRDESMPIAPGMSYAWGVADGPKSAGERDTRADNDSVRARIEAAVNAELERRGYHRAPAADAQLLVHYHVGVRNRVDTLAVPRVSCARPPCFEPRIGWGYWGEPERAVREVEYTQGRLMIDVLARPSLRLAWRGVARGEVTAAAASAERIAKIVAQLLERFPAGPQD